MTLHAYLTRLIWWCVTPLLVLALGLGYLEFRHARDDEGATAQRLAQLLAHNVEQLLQARRVGLQALAVSSLLDDEANWQELHRDVQGIAKVLGGTVLLMDSERRMLLRSDRPFGHPVAPLPESIGRAAASLAFETARPVTSDVFRSPLSGAPVVAVAVPVLRGQRAVHVVLHELALDAMEPWLRAITLPPGWVVTITDGRGQTLARRNGASPTTSEPAATTLRFAARLDSAPWSAEVHLPRETYAQQLLGVALLLLLMLTVVTLISVLGGTWATRRLAHAVRSLAAPVPSPTPPREIDEIRETRQLLNEVRAQREAALESVRVQEERLRGIVASASDAIITADASQTIVMANAAAAAMFGRSAEQLLGLPLEELLPVRLREAHRAHVARFGSDAQSARPMGQRPALWGLHADGREFPIEGSISQVRAAGQHLYTVILRDISERIAAQAEIVAGKARLEATLQSLDEGVVIADTRHHIVQVNPAFLRLYGFATPAECLRPIIDYERLLEISTPDGQVLTPAQWSMPRALRGERASGVELQVRHRDTGRRWIGSFSFGPIFDADGEIAGAVFSVRDVTEQKRMADELLASHRELEQLVAAQTSVQEQERQRIARELHDELQQVLAALKIDIASVLPAMAANPAWLPTLVERMDQLATSAITSSRRVVNDLRPQLLEDFGLVAALELLAAQYMQRLSIRVSVDSDPACRDGGEPPDQVGLCLFRAAQEALNNVAKHARARRVQLRLSRTAAGAWQLRISDDGRGMGVHDRRKPASFGLRGMAERVRALGGELRVDSEPGRGVVVTVSLGAATTTPAGPRSARVQDAGRPALPNG